jgi:hypothetical protein
MIKLAALLITVFLVGCSSVPHVETVTDELVFENSNAGKEALGSPPPMPVPMAPPPVENCCRTNSQLLSQAFGQTPEPVYTEGEGMSAPTASKPKVQHKAAKFATRVVGSIMSAAQAATDSVETKIERDATGSVVKQEEVIKHDSILGTLTKVVGLITGMFGLYVGAKNFKEKFYASTSTKPKRRTGPRVI